MVEKKHKHVDVDEKIQLIKQVNCGQKRNHKQQGQAVVVENSFEQLGAPVSKMYNIVSNKTCINIVGILSKGLNVDRIISIQI